MSSKENRKRKININRLLLGHWGTGYSKWDKMKVLKLTMGQVYVLLWYPQTSQKRECHKAREGASHLHREWQSLVPRQTLGGPTIRSVSDLAD